MNWSLILLLVLTFAIPLQAQTIFDAARSGDVAAIKVLLEKDPALLEARGSMGLTPIGAAILAGQREAVQLLVDAGADLNVHDDGEGFTPLGLAALRGDEAVAALLIDHGASIGGRDSFGGTPLHVAAIGGRPEAVRLLLDRGAHANVRSNDGRTPLAVAIERGRTEAAEVLLSHGADASSRDSRGVTLLQRAVVADNAGMVMLLLRHGADPQVRSPYGNTAVDLAVQDGRKEIVALLSGPEMPAARKKTPVITGPYLGQTLPAASPHMFAPGVISTERHELNAVFTPDGKEFYFTIRGASGWTIMTTAFRGGHWTPPKAAPFSGRWSDVDLFITADGRRLYFCSNRPLEPQGSATKDFDIWMCERTAEGWSTPVNVGAPVNSAADEFYPSVTSDGTMYVQSRRPGGPGAADIWRIRPAGARPAEAECLPSPVNSAGFEGDTLVAPDESWLIVSTSREPKSAQADLFLSLRTPSGGWAPLVKLGPEVNSPASSENCPMLSPDGRFLFFSRGGDVYWVDAVVFTGIEVERTEPQS
ncbi:MAG: ankyrin repeat domain-containing protein [Thermoanaerobaculia bacterium]